MSLRAHLFARPVALMLSLTVLGLFVLPAGCPTGPLFGGAGSTDGTDGTDGVDGTGGSDGTDGTDGTEGTDTVTTGNSGLTGKFLGAEACSLCHSNLHEQWSKTNHAGALETLEAIGQGSNSACLVCHTVGYGQPGGFVDRATTNTLAGVGCENCHGAGLDHRSNVADKNMRPPKSISASVCGQCHNDAHHPTFEEWSDSEHASIPASVASRFAEGRSLTSCGVCHSGDFRQAFFVEGEEDTPDDLLAGVSPDNMNGIVCATCHDPHERTGKAFLPEEGHDIQLRFPQVAFPLPSNDIDDATNPERFNICGQCHHSRGRTWEATSRGPHHSVQANMYAGEMPIPDGTLPLVESNRTVHAFVPKQCSTCHMQHRIFVSEDEPAHTGHKFAVVDTVGCSTIGCHPTPEAAASDLEALQAEVQTALDSIASRLGDVSTWEYSSGGGPEDQASLSDEIKQIRFLYHYVLSDGSLGPHNPEYIRAILDKADELLTSIGK